VRPIIKSPDSPNLLPVESKQMVDAKKFVEDIISKGEPWTDPDFTPTLESVIGTGIRKPKNFGFKLDEVVKQWRRCSEVFKDAVVFNESFSERDI